MRKGHAVLWTCRSWQSSVGVDPLCSGGPMFPREGTLCGSWWAMREVELSTVRCMQVKFLTGEGCGRCVFNLPVTTTDPQALGKERTHACACSTSVGGGRSLCLVKVARKLYHCAVHHGPVGVHPIPAILPLAFCWRSVHQEKRCNTHVPEVGRVDGEGHQSHWARVPSHLGASHGGVGSIHIGVRSGPLVFCNSCRGQGHEGIASNGGA